MIVGLVSQLLVAAVAVALAMAPEKPEAAPLVPSPPPAVDSARIAAPLEVSDDALAELPEATTFGAVRGAPRDPAPTASPSGRLIHPKRTAVVYAEPGGRALAALPPNQLGADTWVPVVAEKPGWVQVLLPSRPNTSTGWIHVDEQMQIARTPYSIEIDRASFELTLYRGGDQVSTWTVGVGKPGAVTPAGRTFILANIRETKETFSPIVLPLGAHSDTHKTYGGGPGTVGIHGWPTDDVLGTATSDGCIRVPDAALEVISTKVPLGTPVLIK